jgi:hypothetical protein
MRLSMEFVDETAPSGCLSAVHPALGAGLAHSR